MSSPVNPSSTNTVNPNHINSDSAKKVPASKVPVGLAKGPNLKNVKSKIGSLQNATHKPKGGERKIESQKLNWNTSSRIGSLENANYKPKGGKVRVNTQKLEWNVKSKIGSFDNIKHTAGRSNVRIFDEKYAASSRATSTTRSGSTTPQVLDQYSADDLLRETEQKLTLHD